MMLKAFVLFILFPSLVAALGTQVSGYDNKRMLTIIENLNGSVFDQLDLIQVTWGKIKADYPEDIGKLDDLCETLNQVICQSKRNVTLQQHLQAYLIREQIVEHLEIQNTTGIIRLALSAPEHDKGNWQLRLTKNTQRLHCLFNLKQLTKIFENVIRKIYKVNLTYQLAILIRQLYVENNRNSYELMVNSELYLYERYKISGQHQQVTSIYLAQLWQEMQKDHFYAGLDQDTKKRLLDAVIELLNYL